MPRPEFFDLTRNSHKLVLIFAALTYAAISFFYLDKYPVVSADEIIYVEPSANFLSEGSFSLKIYPPLGGYHKSSVIQHGRILSFARALIFKFWGINVTSMRIQSFLAGMALLFITFLTAREIFSNQTLALSAAALLALSHPFVFSSHFARPDITVAFFLTASVYFFLRGDKSGKISFYFLSGLLASLAVDIHLSGAIATFVLAGLVGLKTYQKFLDRKTILAVAVGLVVGFSWWVAAHILVDTKLFFEQLSFSKTFAEKTNLWFSFKEEWRRWHAYFWLGAYHRNMFLFGLILLSLFYAFRRRSEQGYAVILALVLAGFAGYALGTFTKNTFYVVYMYPYFMMLVAAAIYDCATSNEYPLRVAGLVLGAGLCGFLFLENLHRVKFYDSNYARYLEKVRTHIPQGSFVLAGANFWIGLKDHCGKFIQSETMMYRSILESKGIQEKYFSGSVEDFFRREKIEYVVADEDMLQGTLFQKESIRPFLENSCETVAEVKDDFYSFSVYMSKRSPRPLQTKILKIKEKP